MALANRATNTTKYVAGGTGDNIIPDGFIKSVEKVWMDSIVLSSSNTIGTGSVWDIAIIPAGKKVTGIEVYLSTGFQALASSSTSISLGARYGTGAVSNATQFLAATTLGTTTFTNTNVQAMLNIGVECTSSTHTIFAMFATVGAAITGGTITTKVKYT